VVGKPAEDPRRTLPAIKEQHELEFVVANVEKRAKARV